MIIPDPEALARAPVLLVGDVMLDRYWSGRTARISPEAPVPVVDVGDFRALPGGAANVALNVAALGARASLLGLVGADDDARTLRSGLDAAGVDHELLAVDGSRTITKMRVLSRNQHLIRLDVEDGFAAADRGALVERFAARVDDAGVVVLSDYAKGTLQAITPELIARARHAGRRVLVDPKGDDFDRYRGASVLTPNRAELERVVGACADLEVLEARARGLVERLGLEALLITRGDEGMSLVPADGEVLHVPAHRREVYDVTGAGDTVIGVLAAMTAAGVDLVAATRLVNQAAAVVVTRLGASQVGLDELRAAEAAEREPDHRVVDEAGLMRAVEGARRRGQRLVMTNGCFDLLHAGHLQGLRAMRAMGDRLIVAVNDDDSVARLKGAGRPLTPLAERTALLAALDCVDWVVAFAEDTPLRLIERVRPDVLAKGGDYAPEDVVGYDAVTRHGGAVRIVDYTPGRSTSALIERIRGGTGSP